MPLVVAENLAKTYGTVKAVDGLSFSLDECSITGLIGPKRAPAYLEPDWDIY